jgi:hypothetical protein
MLRQLRSEKLKKYILIGLMLLVIPSFIFFYGWQRGGRGGAGGQAGPAATIKYSYFSKKEIDQPALLAAKNMLAGKLHQYAKEKEGMELDRATIENIVQSPEIVRQAIETVFLEDLAREQSIVIPSSEVEGLLMQIPPQQRTQFLNQLAAQGMGLEAYFSRLQHDLLLSRVQQLLSQRVRVSYYEGWLQYLLQNQKFVADFVRFDVLSYLPKVKVEEPELAQYFEKNRQAYYIPDQVQYAYLLVRKDDLKSSITVTEDEITSYYRNRMEEFRLDPAVHVRQIFLNKPMIRPQDRGTSAGQEAETSRTAILAKATEIFQRAAKREDFSSLAATFDEERFPPPRDTSVTSSTDAVTTAPGDLGYVLRNNAKSFYGDDWTSTVFNAKPGSLLPPIETPRGFHIVFVVARREGVVQPLERVREVVADKIRAEKVEPVFEKLGESLRENAAKFTSLEKVAEVTSVSWAMTEKVDKGANFINPIGLLRDFREPVMDLQKGGRTDVLSDESRLLVIEMREEFPAHDPAIEEVRDKVAVDFKNSRAREMAIADAQTLKSKSTSLETMRTAATDMGLTVTTSRPFSDADVSMVLGPLADFDTIARQSKAGDILLSPLGKAKDPSGYLVWRVTEKIEPSRKDYDKDLAKVLNEISQKKAEILVQEYLRDRWKELGSKIEINKQFQ